MDIKLNNINFTYKDLPIFTDLNLTINKGKVTVILGPSGCGKTTLLNLISNTLKPDSGVIQLPDNFELSYIYQEPRLLPWKTTEQNIKFVLDNLPLDGANKRVQYYLEQLELFEFKNYYPNQLSGGMRQRVSIARAFAYPSNSILMDEPFKGLDLALKLNLFKLFNNLWRKEERTAIFVTHDIHEAILLGDEIIVLSKRPVTIKKHITNPIPHTQRTLHNPNLLELEKELYKILT
ncbi:MAG: ABC transporter ATP-binding protein [Spirochaetaceae bacterium]